jgi:hypothetical protein
MTPTAVSDPFERDGKWWLTVTYSDGIAREKGPYTERDAKQSRTKRLRWIERRLLARQRSAEVDIPDFDGTLKWFLDLIAAKAKQLAMTSDPEVRKDLQALAHAGVSAKNLFDTSKLEERIAQLEEHDKSVDRAAKHAIGPRRTSQGVRETAEPSQPLH